MQTLTNSAYASAGLSSQASIPGTSQAVSSLETAPTSVSKSPSMREPLRMIRAKSSLVSRNVTIAGHRTSVRLEPEMWNGLAEICRRECATTHEVCTVVAAHKPAGTSLTAAIRVFVMAYFRAASTEDGHNRAGHGPGGQLMMSMLRAKELRHKKVGQE